MDVTPETAWDRGTAKAASLGVSPAVSSLDQARKVLACPPAHVPGGRA